MKDGGPVRHVHRGYLASHVHCVYLEVSALLAEARRHRGHECQALEGTPLSIGVKGQDRRHRDEPWSTALDNGLTGTRDGLSISYVSSAHRQRRGPRSTPPLPGTA